MSAGAGIVDLFGGAGGWSEGLRLLGRASLGIEQDAWACRTARAGGHRMLRGDVAALDPHRFTPTEGVIASAPCQAWSRAGTGAGRRDRDHVIACAYELAVGYDTRDQHRCECEDARSILVVEPLRWALALRPRWIALEQVPDVLELWSLFAHLLGALGYDTWVGVLNAANYGVPQTRERAILIAGLDGAVGPPAPTHSDQRRGLCLFGLEPWVTMAQALGWTGLGRPARMVSGGRAPGWAYDAPSPTLTTTPRHEDGILVYPQWRNGNQSRAAVRSADEPAPANHFGNNAHKASWVFERPATTIACDRRVHPPGHKENAQDPPGRYERRRGANAIPVGLEQAAILQGFRPDYPWRGNKTQRFTQVGNAIPPPLARAVLAEAMRPTSGVLGAAA